MDKYKRVLAVVVAYNTAESTKQFLTRFPKERKFDVLIVNDGSTDRTAEYLKDSGFNFITHSNNKGVGGAIKTGIRYALDNNYYAMVIMAGNNKDDPAQIEGLFKPILEEDCDYIQGSRFLKGGKWDNLPVFRYVMVKVHALMFFVLTGFRGTDALNGFRAYKLSIFKEPRINIWQEWLDHYELETYLHYKVLKLGYKVKEVRLKEHVLRSLFLFRLQNAYPGEEVLLL